MTPFATPTAITRRHIEAQFFCEVVLTLETPAGTAQTTARRWLDFEDGQWHTAVLLPTLPQGRAGYPIESFDDLERLLKQTFNEARALSQPPAPPASDATPEPVS